MYGGNFCHLLKFGVEKDLSESEVLSPNPWNYLAEQEVTLVMYLPDFHFEICYPSFITGSYLNNVFCFLCLDGC